MAQEYNPYDLIVVNREDVNPAYFYIITQVSREVHLCLLTQSWL